MSSGAAGGTASETITAAGSSATSGPAVSSSGTPTGASTSAGSSADVSTSATSSAAAPSTSGALLGSNGCIKDFDPKADYFPDKQTLDYATNFTLSYHKSYEILTVKQPYQGAKPESYVLLRCGAPKPALSGDLAKAQQVTDPGALAVLRVHHPPAEPGDVGSAGRADRRGVGGLHL